MDQAIKLVGDSFILTLLVTVWIAVCIVVAICARLIQIHRCVETIRKERQQAGHETGQLIKSD